MYWHCTYTPSTAALPVSATDWLHAAAEARTSTFQSSLRTSFIAPTVSRTTEASISRSGFACLMRLICEKKLVSPRL